MAGVVALAGFAAATGLQAQQADMSFFVTSAGPGDGANLGGLEGADAHCAALAKAAGATKTDWKAYLSTTAPGGEAGVNARDRIGNGPWKNAKGIVVANSVDELHSDATNVTKETALTEKGEMVKGRGDEANMHDILTGSDPHGHVLDRRRRHDLRQLDFERRRLGHRRPPRPHRPQGHPPHDIVEFVPRHPRLQRRGAEGHRRQRPLLLFRGGIKLELVEAVFR